VDAASSADGSGTCGRWPLGDCLYPDAGVVSAYVESIRGIRGTGGAKVGVAACPARPFPSRACRRNDAGRHGKTLRDAPDEQNQSLTAEPVLKGRASSASFCCRSAVFDTFRRGLLMRRSLLEPQLWKAEHSITRSDPKCSTGVPRSSDDCASKNPRHQLPGSRVGFAKGKRL
jgi:hypothetical protein